MLFKFFNAKTEKLAGVDIGSHAIKAVLLSQSDHGYKVERVACLPIPHDAITDNSISDVLAVSKVLTSLSGSFMRSGVTAVATAISGLGVFNKTLYIDEYGGESVLTASIEIEAEDVIPHPMDEVNFDYEIVKSRIGAKDKLAVLLVAARKDLIRSRVQALTLGNFHVKVMDVEGYALGRCIELIKHQVSTVQWRQPLAIVDIGASTLTVAIVLDGMTQDIKTQAFGGEQYTRSIMTHCNMTRQQAEDAKIEGTLSAQFELRVLAQFQSSLIQQLKRMLQMLTNTGTNTPINFMVLSGGCAHLANLDSAIAQALNIDCVIARPFVECDVTEKINTEWLNQQGSHYMIACGLAMRNFSDDKY